MGVGTSRLLGLLIALGSQGADGRTDEPAGKDGLLPARDESGGEARNPFQPSGATRRGRAWSSALICLSTPPRG